MTADVQVLQKRTFLEFRSECKDSGFTHRRARSLTDSFVDYKWAVSVDEATSCGDSRDTESECSWSTDQEETATPPPSPVMQASAPQHQQQTNGFMWVAVHVPIWTCAMPQVASPPQAVCTEVKSETQDIPSAGFSSRRRGRGGRRTTEPQPASKAESVSDETTGCEDCTCIAEVEATTIIFRNLPSNCTRDDLIQSLESEGFSGCFDFVHVPVNFQAMTGNGYGLVNMVDRGVAECALNHFQGWNQWQAQTSAVCELGWSDALQGLTAHVERYRDSPVMHDSISESYKPALFENGARVQFPSPTKQLRAPRVRHNKARLAE